MEVIDKFWGKHRFLSNFWPVKIEYEGLIYPSVEHAYQAAKTIDINQRIRFTTNPGNNKLVIKPGEAKRYGKYLELRDGWEDIKLDIMESLLRIKFTESQLKQLLINTLPAKLIEGNTWKDTYYGVYNGVGQNNLGILLMKIRQELIDNIFNNQFD